MVLTEYKSPEEIRHSLGKAGGVVIFSCSGCANMNEIGGRRGLKFMKKRLSAWGYTVVAGATPPGDHNPNEGVYHKEGAWIEDC